MTVRLLETANRSDSARRKTFERGRKEETVLKLWPLGAMALTLPWLIFLVLLAVLFIFIALLSHRALKEAFIRKAPIPLEEKAKYKNYSPEQKRYLDIAIRKGREFAALEPEVLTMRRDGLTLKAAYKAPAEPLGTVVIVHGWRDQRTYRYHEALDYYRAGYAVLLPDLRASGESEGKWIDLALYYRKDLLAWIDLLRTQKGVRAPFILDGLSMGAATVLSLSGADELDPEVLAILADCPYTSLKQQSLHMLSGLPKPLPTVILYLIGAVASLAQGHSVFQKRTALAAVQKAQVPIFIIHGEADKFVPFRFGRTLYERASSPIKRFKAVPDCGHADAVYIDPDYMRDKLAFIEAAKAGAKMTAAES